MSHRFKTFIVFISLLFCFLAGARWVKASSRSDEMGPDSKLYQRVKSLENYGLLDASDQEVLDKGQRVTRLDLVFYAEKALDKLAPTELAFYRETPTIRMSEPLFPNYTPTPIPTPTPSIDPELKRQIEDLLKQLKEAAAPLHADLSWKDQHIKEQAAEMDQLGTLQDEVDAVFKKGNHYVRMPTFSGSADFGFDTMWLTGPLITNPLASSGKIKLSNGKNAGGLGSKPLNDIQASQNMQFSMTSDFGGKSTLTMGFGGSLSESNVSAGYGVGIPLVDAVVTADAQFPLNGPLGNWSCHLVNDGHPPGFDDFTLPDPGSSNYTDIFDPAPYYHLKNVVDWNNYMTNLGFTPPVVSAAGNLTPNYRAFKGIYGTGQQLPLLAESTKLTLLAGIQDITKGRWEEGVMAEGPWLGPENFRMHLAGYWVNDHMGDPTLPYQVNNGSYGFGVNWDLDPLFFNLTAGYSQFYTGVTSNYSKSPATLIKSSTSLEGPAVEGYAAYYPFKLDFFGVSDQYANPSGLPTNTVINYAQYGDPSFSDIPAGGGWVAGDGQAHTGVIGMADTIENDRWGWKANFGWWGRKLNWMKNWPKFLDNILVNFDYAQKKEFKYTQDNAGNYNTINGHNAVEVKQLTTFYYQTYGPSIWNDLWGNGGATWWDPIWNPTKSNAGLIRNDGLGGLDGFAEWQQSWFRFKFNIPADALGNPILPLSPSNNPAVVAGKNKFYMPVFLKSYTYITVTTKIEFNKLFNLPSPVYGSVFFTDNKVSSSGDPILPDIPNLFDQQVLQVNGMFQPFKYIDLMAQYTRENWKSNYTYPLTDITTAGYGLGLSYDFPWGGGWFNLRYKHLVYTDKFVVDAAGNPLNNYQGDQIYGDLNFQFPN